MRILKQLASPNYDGNIHFTIEEMTPDRVVGKMAVQSGILNPFGTVHAGAMIWFADVAATICAIGEPESVDDDGRGFPLAIDLHTVLMGNQDDGILTATATPIRRGKKIVIVRTEVTGKNDRTLIEMTSTHLRA